MEWKCSGGIDCRRSGNCLRWQDPATSIEQKFKNFYREDGQCGFFIPVVEDKMEKKDNGRKFTVEYYIAAPAFNRLIASQRKMYDYWEKCKERGEKSLQKIEDGIIREGLCVIPEIGTFKMKERDPEDGEFKYRLCGHYTYVGDNHWECTVTEKPKE